MRRIERLINLIAALLEAPKPMTAEEIHKRIAGYGEQVNYDAFRRTFERDKEALRAMGIPLETRPTDPFVDQADGYIIPKSKYYLPQLDLEPDELAALKVAAEAVLGAEEEATSGLLKVSLAKEPPQWAGPRVVWGADVGAQQPLLGRIYSALLDKRALSFAYTPAAGERSTRSVEPYGLVHRRGHWYLVGRDIDRDDLRSFKLSRIEEPLVLLDSGYEIPSGFDAAAHVAEALQVGTDDPESAIVRFDESVAWWAEQNLPDAIRGATDDGAIEVEIAVGNIDALISWVLGFGDAVEIVSPPEARARLIDHLNPYLEVVQ